MFKETVIEYYGTQKTVADALGISQPCVSNWKTVIPERQALKLERLTGGELQYNEALYQKHNTVVAA